MGSILEQADNITATPKSAEKSYDNGSYGLKSKWPITLDVFGGDMPCRAEGEVADLVVLGEIPPEIDGTFYRVMVDPFVPPDPGNVPLDGDGHVSAFRFHKGHVDMKVRYVETERLKLERTAGRRMFGLYRNPYTHHPCVRAAVDSTANTNVVPWANKLLALKEGGLPYELDLDTLETIRYDPFEGQVKAKTFTAHPKYDPFKGELVVFGYEATGLCSDDIVVYSLDKNGKKIGSEKWIKSPWVAPIHDCAITPDWLILFLWPFETDIERLKQGKLHWAWSYDRPTTMVLVPRTKEAGEKYGWKESEYRSYHWDNCMLIHTSAGWEENGKIYVESSRVHDNALPFFPPVGDNPRMPSPGTKADFVRWAFDPSAPDGTRLQDPEVVLDIPAEFPRIDERFMTTKYEYLWLNVIMPGSDDKKNLYHCLNALAMHSNKTGKTRFYYAGDEALTQEPIFIPRTDKEGDGWVMAMVERRKEARCDLVIIDTENFERPVAIVQLPIHLKSQVHGNWVDAKLLPQRQPLVRQLEVGKISGLGALEPL